MFTFLPPPSPFLLNQHTLARPRAQSSRSFRLISAPRLKNPRKICGERLRSAERAADIVSGEDIPSSLEESIQDACQALRVAISGGKQRKGKRGKKQKSQPPRSLRRLEVEVPVLDTSSETLSFLAGTVAQELSSEGPVSVILADSNVDDFPKDVPYVSVLADLSQAPKSALTNRLVIVAPGQDAMQEVMDLVIEVWRGEVVVLVSPQWGKSLDDELKSFRRSFETVYSYLPLAMQGLLGKKEGALLKWVKEKNKTTMWRIFVKGGDGLFMCVGQQAERPKDKELELAMYNASAAESPVTKGIKFLRNLGAGQK